jgi:nucleoside-diphosphate-sugar epimerase
MASTLKIAVTGAAGLIGQNLIPRLKARGYANIVALDKHKANTAILRRLHPDIAVVEADLAHGDGWQAAVADADVVVLSHAQIGGLEEAAFVANNVTATQRILDAVRAKSPYLVHLSSSVVESVADDWYTQTKDAQEKLVVSSGLPHVVLRPTLMFGWFDRKHLGWLARFMQKAPVFPIPGSGRYLRQPLYAGDFCDIIMACIEQRPTAKAYNISGQEKIDYIDLIRAVREASGAGTPIVRIPYSLFWALLWAYGLFDRDPPFTTRQLEALVIPELFEVIDWPGIFGVTATPLKQALADTYRHPDYSKIVLEF